MENDAHRTQMEGPAAALARHLGVSKVAVSKAIKKGRFMESLTTRDGRAWFTDFLLAEREWHENVDRSRAPASVKDLAAFHEPDDDQEDAGGEDAGPSLSKASALEKHWKAQLAELTYKQRAGELVDAAAVTAEYSDFCTTVRTKLLGLPSRMKQAHPDLTLEQLATLDDYVREALEELAAGDAEEPAV